MGDHEEVDHQEGLGQAQEVGQGRVDALGHPVDCLLTISITTQNIHFLILNPQDNNIFPPFGIIVYCRHNIFVSEQQPFLCQHHLILKIIK